MTITCFFGRYNLPQVVVNIRNKQSMVSSEKQHTTTDDDDDDEGPIKFSESKAASMRIDEYRMPQGDTMPWYQPPIISLSLAVFLIYFCILREENDIDLILDQDLGTRLSQLGKQDAEEKVRASR